ncbi:4'-phosphopantetheinyl transferase superfamily protein [Chitinophaga sp. 30R24]|uniref:4'-phosphopantetheinyl transferase superfamily protein n=1 Tax=Chitinophaga sp. 30R24 TaxID=3248838 RepID=UPI003B91B0B9
MIGNDIVDLQVAERESRIHRRGFLDKLFLRDEQALIFQAAQPAVMVWMLWSCKEAVYKIVHRRTRERKYAPLQFNCRLQQEANTAAGTVHYQQELYYFQSCFNAARIHTYAAGSQECLQRLQVFTIVNQQEEDVSGLARQAILPDGYFFYKDEDGIPYIHCSGNGSMEPVSVSHHGRYLGIVKLSGYGI